VASGTKLYKIKKIQVTSKSIIVSIVILSGIVSKYRPTIMGYELQTGIILAICINMGSFFKKMDAI